MSDSQFNPQTWLADLAKDGSATPEELATLTAFFGKAPVAAKVRDQVLARSDYSRSQDELRKEREALKAEADAKQAALTAEYQRLADWKKTADSQLGKYDGDLQAAQRRTVALEAQIRKFAVENGLDADDLLKEAAASVSTPATPAEPPKAPGETPAEYMKRLQEAERALTMSPTIMARLYDLGEDHRELFGSRLNTSALLAEATAAGKPLDIYWAEKFKVAEKRAELAAQAASAHDAKVAQEAVTKYASEHNLPVSSLTRPKPFVLEKFGTQTDERERAADGVKSEARVANAVSKFREAVREKGIAVGQ